jgi:hypothetical protein
VTEAAEAGIAHPGEGDDGRLLHAADRHQDVGAVDHRPEHDHHVAGLDGDVVRRLQLAPASPLTSATNGSPPAVWASSSLSRASSSARPTKRPVMTWYAMPPSMPAPAPDEGRCGRKRGREYADFT